MAKVFTGDCLGLFSPFTVGRSGGEPKVVGDSRLSSTAPSTHPVWKIKQSVLVARSWSRVSLYLDYGRRLSMQGLYIYIYVYIYIYISCGNARWNVWHEEVLV